MEKKFAVLGINPDTGIVVAAGRDDDEFVVDLFRQGLILVRSDVETAREKFGEQAGNICSLAKG